MLISRPLRQATETARDERGGVLVWVVIFLPVLFLFVSFALDAGNWWEHRRHLQTQADAAALAGGAEFAFPCGGTTASNIETVARDYGGPHEPENPAAPYNAQIGGTPPDRMHLLVNSSEFWNKGGTNYSDGGGPCATNFLDIKITESDLPFFFPLVADLVPAINAHARVTILQAEAIAGSLPLFVRDVNPNSAAALFVAAPVVGASPPLAARYLDKVDVEANPGSCPSGGSCWDNFANPTDPLLTAGPMSMVVALSSLPQCSAVVTTGCMSLLGSVDTICTQFGVECYWADSTTGAVQAGIVYLRGYPATSVLLPSDPPVLGDVRLHGAPSGGSTCPDGSFFHIASGSCTVQVEAEVRRPEDYVEDDMQIIAFGGSCPNQGCALNFDAVSSRWTGLIPIGAQTVPPTHSIRIDWEVRSPSGTLTMTGKGACRQSFGGNNPCVGSFPNAQRAFSASDQTSGAIRQAYVYVAPDTTTPIDSLADGSLVQLTASVRLAGSVATDSSDAPIQLRVVTNQAAIDCQPGAGTNLRYEITKGCAPLYTINDRLQAPDPCDPPYGQNQTDLWNNTTDVPWDCVATSTGAQIGQFTDGLFGRVFNGGNVCQGGGCPNVTAAQCADPTFVGRNNWASSFPDFPPRDSRIVTLFMVPFGAFRSTGQALYAISNFGAFYITDWGGANAGTDDPCGTDGSVPSGWLSGHFITHVLTLNTGGGSGPCDTSVTTPCVAVLTE